MFWFVLILRVATTNKSMFGETLLWCHWTLSNSVGLTVSSWKILTHCPTLIHTAHATYLRAESTVYTITIITWLVDPAFGGWHSSSLQVISLGKPGIFSKITRKIAVLPKCNQFLWGYNSINPANRLIQAWCLNNQTHCILKAGDNMHAG